MSQPIHVAASSGNINALQTELIKGVDIDSALTNGGWTPLHCAARSNKPEAAKFLVAARANVESTDDESRTALHLACERDHVAVAAVLLDAKAQIDARDRQSFTPLIRCADEGKLACAKLLLERKADPTLTVTDGGFKGKTAFDIAKFSKRDKLVALLQPVSPASAAPAASAAAPAKKSSLFDDTLPLSAPAGVAEKVEFKAFGVPVASLSVDQVCEWLGSLSLGKHAARFRANEVNGSLLLALSADDLKNDLGVSSGLELKKLQLALDELKAKAKAGEKSAEPAVAVASTASTTVTGASSKASESGAASTKLSLVFDVADQVFASTAPTAEPTSKYYTKFVGDFQCPIERSELLPNKDGNVWMRELSPQVAAHKALIDKTRAWAGLTGDELKLWPKGTAISKVEVAFNPNRCGVCLLSARS